MCTETRLQKIAFVAMPFRVKPTGLQPENGPTQVDFDALWERAFRPALTELNYMPIRADLQTGSVIIKDMLEQLVYADLVLVDLSIPNANVYYEAGVRHAAREKGCILISAAWAKPVFDLAQITVLRYPFPVGPVTQSDYNDIRETLSANVPELSGARGPVYTLTRIASDEPRTTRHLKEVSSQLFDFQSKLSTAREQSADGEPSALRELAESDFIVELPTYAMRELVYAARDGLHWAELQDLLNRLPKRAFDDDPTFFEQQALAIGKQGKLHEAIALLESVIRSQGETPERLGTLGSRYRALARDEPNRVQKRKHQARAVDAYRRGMLLDLNQYYCAHKLMITLMERGRRGDIDEARRCSSAVKVATQRARVMDVGDEWLNATEAIHAFFVRDDQRAADCVDAVLDQGWANWKLMGLSVDLQGILDLISEEERKPFQEIYDSLDASLPITQDRLMDNILPLINDHGKVYEKFQQVHARMADKGERIISTTSAGEETINFAKPGDMVVENLTDARELYLVGSIKFAERYRKVRAVDDCWALYKPLGEVRALEISPEVMTQLDVDDEFYINAPWGERQIACARDYLVSPCPASDEIYRIGRLEFEQTYRMKADI